MSWFSLSLPNPFKSDEDQQNPSSSSPTHPSPDHTPAAVKEDLSLLGQTLGRQLRGVASFLAPPPPSVTTTSPPHSDDSSPSSSQAFAGIKNDLVEIGGSFKTSLSLLSSNKTVTGFSWLASNFLRFQEEEGGEGDHEEAVGITDEVLHFITEISQRPECWTDFPLSISNDFVMSDAQREHAATIEDMVPTLAALRHKICHDLSEEKFWMIYFILVLPRLNEYGFKLLSTPEIVEVREILLQKLQKKKNAPADVCSEESPTVDTFQKGGSVTTAEGIESLPEGKEVLDDAANTTEGFEIDDPEKSEQWLEEEEEEDVQSADEEDVSFSDLEDDNNDLPRRLSGFRSAQSNKVPPRSESSEWIQLNQNTGDQQKVGQSNSREKDSEGEESSDWLTVDDTDLEN